jgi:hypothetical protein
MTPDMNGLLPAPGTSTRETRSSAPPALRASNGSTGRASRRSPGRPAVAGGSGRDRCLRRVVVGVLVGALTMLGVATLDVLGGATVPVLGSFAALPTPSAPAVVEVPPPPTTPGTCLTWSRADAADTAVVDCTQPHLFEQAGAVVLADQGVLPDDAGWRQLVNERCTPVVVEYLQGRFDPDGRFRVGALKPAPAKWDQGDRQLRCGLQSASRSGALYPIVGKVAESDQAAVHEPGTCLGIDGRTIGDPVQCGGVHAVEAVGIVDLSAKFSGEDAAFPQVADQDAFLQPECTRIAAEYAGNPEAIAAKKLTVYWDNLTEESWKVGSRKVNCNLAALLPDRSGFAPVTGSVRDAVVIVGETPAPPAQATQAGVPAQQPPPQPAAPPPVEVPAPDAPPPAPLEGATPPVDANPPVIVPDGLPLPAEG